MAYQHSCAIFAIGDLSKPNPVLLMKLHNNACLLYWHLLIACNSSWGCYYIYQIIHQYEFFNSCNFTLSCIKSISSHHIRLHFFFLITNYELLFPYYFKTYDSHHQVVCIYKREWTYSPFQNLFHYSPLETSMWSRSATHVNLYAVVEGSILVRLTNITAVWH